MAERRFKRFEGDIEEVIERGRYDEDDFKNVKDLKRDIEDIIDRYEDVITYLDSVYSAKPANRDKEMTEVADSFSEFAERRHTVRKKVKEANEVIEVARNKEEAKKNKEEKLSGSGGRRGGVKQEAEKQFKQPTGVLPDNISSDYTPLMTQDWASNMRLYIKTCSNLDILSRTEQRTLCRRFVDPALWSQVIFFNNDDMATMVKRVEEMFDKLQPLFSRKVKFLDWMIMKGEG